MPDRADFLKCRDLGHHWEEDFPGGRRPAPWGHRRILLCTSCGAERSEIVNSHSGEVDARSYTYEEDYKKYTGYTKQEARKMRMRIPKGRR